MEHFVISETETSKLILEKVLNTINLHNTSFLYKDAVSFLKEHGLYESFLAKINGQPLTMESQNSIQAWTLQDELKDFLETVKLQLHVIQKAAERGEQDGNYLAEKYGDIERTANKFKRRLTTYKK